MNQYTFLIDLGRTRPPAVVSVHDTDMHSAQRLALSTLRDVDKERVRAVSLIAKGPSQLLPL